MIKNHYQFQPTADHFCRFLLKTADELYDRQRTELSRACGLRHDTIKRV